jgi:hypothetical protein
VYGGAWLFTKNTEYYPGTHLLKQSPISTVETHVSYNLTLRAWAAWDMTWYGGGRQSLNGVPKTSRQDNTRMGATVSLPVGQRHTVKFRVLVGPEHVGRTRVQRGVDRMANGLAVALTSYNGAAPMRRRPGIPVDSHVTTAPTGGRSPS